MAPQVPGCMMCSDYPCLMCNIERISTHCWGYVVGLGPVLFQLLCTACITEATMASVMHATMASVMHAVIGHVTQERLQSNAFESGLQCNGNLYLVGAALSLLGTALDCRDTCRHIVSAGAVVPHACRTCCRTCHGSCAVLCDKSACCFIMCWW